ncbi:MAG: ribosome rescue GTPase HflX [Pseudomonadales bacterium]|nr:ribosome rescue GTPase HflX [Pseudomonadales bacterium]
MFFERPASGDVAILVHMNVESAGEDSDPREFEELALSAGASPAAFIIGNLKKVSARLFVGSGKLEEIRQAVLLHQAEIVLFDHTLTPSQERNLEKELSCRVLDRTGLILDIFAQRARSHEGKLQVELAQLRHSVTRLVRGWTHLDRQKGGIGLRGAGETQLEIDQRLIGVRIKAINKGLAKVRSQRNQGRRARKRAEIPTISLVGYTNAGKSSLFNRLSHSDIYVANQLFATLDSTLRKIQIPDYGTAIVADTVGFIRKLPHQLVDAFHATLEETVEASLLLHVIDCHDENRDMFKEQVDTVLKEIGAIDIPTLLVYNKVDLLDSHPTGMERDDQGKPLRVWVSAATGAGLGDLLQAISELLGNDVIEPQLQILPQQGRLRARLYRQGAVQAESVDDEGKVELSLRLPRDEFIRLLRAEGIDPLPLLPALISSCDSTAPPLPI